MKLTIPMLELDAVAASSQTQPSLALHEISK